MSGFSPSFKVQNSVIDSQEEQRRSCQSKPAPESHLDLLEEGTFSDVTFIVGPSEERIPCHQLFLKARSPVFEAMFSVRWSQERNTEVLLEDIDPKIFKMFLEYIYADTLVATVSEALELLQLAHKYDVQLLLTKCEELLEKQLTLDVAVDVFQASRKYDKIQRPTHLNSAPNAGSRLTRLLQLHFTRPTLSNAQLKDRHTYKFSMENVRSAHCRASIYNRVSGFFNSQVGKKKSVALSGMTLFCPTNSSGGTVPTLSKEFGIVLKAKRSNEKTYRELHTFCPVKAQEGKLTDVELDIEVPLESGVCYCITVEEIRSTQGTTGSKVYEMRDFGSIQRSVTANLASVDLQAPLDRMVMWGPMLPQLLIDPKQIFAQKLAYSLTDKFNVILRAGVFS